VLKKSIVAAAASLALIAAPTVAAAQSAPTAQPATSEVAPAAEQVDGSEMRGGYLLPLAVIIAAIIAGYFLFLDDDSPDSP
jgi:hypothetical protein